MNRLSLLASLALFLTSCVTRPWQQPQIEFASEEEERDEGFRFGSFCQNIIDQNRQSLHDEQKILEKKLQQSSYWEDQLKLAVILMTQTDSSQESLQQAKELLLAVVRAEETDEEARAGARWLLVMNQQSLMQAEQLQAQTLKNKDLQQKLHALSTIEQKLEKRSRNDIR